MNTSNKSERPKTWKDLPGYFTAISGDYANDTRTIIELAETYGMKIIYSQPRLLIVDLDSEKARQEFITNVCFSKDAIRYNIADSGSVNHYHAVVLIKKPVHSITERIILQRSLGSDVKKEDTSLSMVKTGVKHPSILIVTPEAYKKLLFGINPVFTLGSPLPAQTASGAVARASREKTL